MKHLLQGAGNELLKEAQEREQTGKDMRRNFQESLLQRMAIGGELRRELLLSDTASEFEKVAVYILNIIESLRSNEFT